MTLYFSDDRERLNINFKENEYNGESYPEADYIKITPEDMARLSAKCEKEMHWTPQTYLQMEGRENDFTL